MPRPFALTTTTSLPTRTSEAGYHSVGTRPRRVPRVVSKSATALLSASATNRRLPSAEIARAFGVLPSCGPAGGASLKVLTTLAVLISTMEIESVVDEVTNSRFPLSSNADGWRATVIRERLPRVPSPPTANAFTVWPPQQETYR